MNHCQTLPLTSRTLRALKSIGKRCFVNCFERARLQKGDLTDNDIIECDPEVGRDGFGFRTSSLKQIFSEGQQYAALKECCNSKRLPQIVNKKAKDLFCQYETSA